MAHSINPNTSYTIITLSVAIPAGDTAQCADHLNEVLRPLAIEGAIADYCLHGLKDTVAYVTGDQIEEGEMFSSVSATVQNTKYEVQHYTMCDGWINTWIVSDKDNTETPLQFATEELAQSDLDEFIQDMQDEILRGERPADDGYGDDEFRTVPVTAASSM